MPKSAEEAARRPPPEEFHALDAVRGIGAVVVLLYHAKELFAPSLIVAVSDSAVDLFFILSGFVLGHAYDRRLAGGMSLGGFLRVRLIRCYPLYLAGTAIGICGIIGARLAGSDVRAEYDTIVAIAAALLMLPSPPFTGGGWLYPFNVAAWTLFYELVINALFAAQWRKLHGATLLATTGLFGAMLVLSTTLLGPESAATGAGVLHALSRTGFAFFAGLIIYRHYRAGSTPSSGVSPLLLLGAMMLVFLLYGPAERRGFGPLYDLICTLLVFPLLIASIVRARTGGELGKWFRAAGMSSYALYIVHVPLLFLYTGILVRVAGVPVDALTPWAGIAFLAAMLPLSWALDRFYDTPLRSWLTQLERRRYPRERRA